MHGINSKTGKSLTGLDHLKQSVADILMTPLGSRVMRREYGSRLFYLVDAPLNRSTILDIYAASAEALARWEPRFILQKISVASINDGHIILDLEGIYRPTGQAIKLDRITIK